MVLALGPAAALAVSGEAGTNLRCCTVHDARAAEHDADGCMVRLPRASSSHHAVPLTLKLRLKRCQRAADGCPVGRYTQLDPFESLVERRISHDLLC